MPDREKVIKGLEQLIADFKPFCGNKADWQRVYDALALLKAQEPKPVYVTAEIKNRKIGECPNCSKMINSGDYPNYCGQCGQAVKWDG